MNCLHCCVSPVEKGWIAQLEHAAAGPFYSRDMALQVAVAEAMHAHRGGQPARVAVRDRDGRIRAAHCLCGDFKCPLRWPP
jgi:hypothetical protein